jgi:VanZ family protein
MWLVVRVRSILLHCTDYRLRQKPWLPQSHQGKPEQIVLTRLNRMPRYFLSPKIHQQIGWLLVGVIVSMSLMPGVPLPQVNADYSDKIAHCAIYASLMGWFASATPRARWGYFAVSVFTLGATLEACQALLPYRTASLADTVANGIGVAFGAIIAFIITTGSEVSSRAE